MQRRVTRAGLLKAGLVFSSVVVSGRVLGGPDRVGAGTPSPLPFAPIAPDTGDRIVVPAGYRALPLISWGDPILGGDEPFALNAVTASSQERRFGFNCDFVMFMPLPAGSNSSNDGLLWVNHEYTDGAMMFPGYDAAAPSSEQVAVELAAHGASIVRVTRGSDGVWAVDPAHPANRRITATTPMAISGPAAGHALLRTSADPTGSLVLGMLNNCGGGVTPWGTVLTAEENFQQYFGNLSALDSADPRWEDHDRYGISEERSERGWELFDERFDVGRHANEPFRFGWIVEVDPYDPSFTPLKRTALGRLKHEAATIALGAGGRVVAYTGDDERFEYVYKYVSHESFRPHDREHNLRLLDEGTLFVARFHEDGTGAWIPLVYGPTLNEYTGFSTQADILLRTRAAADLVGATKMDRPEDIETNPVTGKVYLALTNNTRRGVEDNPGIDAANPRPENAWGHIIEITEARGDAAALSFTWEVFLLCGDPSDPSTYFAGFDADQVSAIANPDNLTFDRAGNLWIATDGQPSSLSINDGIFGVPTEGPDRGHVKQLLSAVPGAEVASLVFTPDSRTLFASIQHPGEGGSLAEPLSRWPGDPARPTVIAVSREDGGIIGL